MPRTARIAPGGTVFHVLNRGVGKMRLFLKDADFEALERTIEKTLQSRPMRICSYCLMPNHWHFVLWPERDGDLAAFMQKLTITHVRNWQENRRRVGYGHLYQGRYKSFPVESDEHFYQVVRYVERNALRANAVARAEDWRWSSLWRRVHGKAEERRWLGAWPAPRPRAWADLVNQPWTEAELDAIRRSVLRGQPYGGEDWVKTTAKQFGTPVHASITRSTEKQPIRPYLNQEIRPVPFNCPRGFCSDKGIAAAHPTWRNSWPRRCI